MNVGARPVSSTAVVALQEEALARAHERAMERYVERREELARRPHLGQRIADYHLGLLTHLGELAAPAAFNHYLIKLSMPTTVTETS